METIKTQNIFPNINGAEFVKSHTQVIDNPRDNDLKRRQTLWSFQNKNRGACGKFKNNDGQEKDSLCIKDEDDTETENVRTKHTKRLNFPKLKQKVAKDNCSSSVPDDSTAVKREYSSAIRIGNSLYEQLRTKQKLDKTNNSLKSKSVLKTFGKFPDVTSSLSKLSYLKAARNVVHYGGGFFGRNNNTEKRYTDFRRSITMLSPAESKILLCENRQGKKLHNASLKSLENKEGTKTLKTDHGDILTILSHDLSAKIVAEGHLLQSKEKRKPERDKENDLSKKSKGDLFEWEVIPNKNRKSKESKVDIIEKEILTEKFSISFEKQEIEDSDCKSKKSLDDTDKKRNEEWQRDIDLIVAKHENENKQSKTETSNKGQSSKKAKVMKTKSTNTTTKNHNWYEKSESDESLDLPEEQFGPTSYRPDDAALRQLNAAFCINPYKWTSRSSLTANDQSWVEKAMERTDLIDTTVYDGFARKKTKSTLKAGDLCKEKTQLSAKPP